MANNVNRFMSDFVAFECLKMLDPAILDGGIYVIYFQH